MKVPRWIGSTAATAAASVTALATLTVAPPASAQSSPVFFPARYVVCHDEKAAPAPAASPSTEAVPALALVPVARKRAPAPLDIAPLEIADVALVEPLPVRAPLPTALPTAPVEKIVLLEGENDFHCTGFTRGRAGILRVVSAPRNARFAHHGDGVSWRLVNYRAAGAIGMTDAIPHLRREVDRPVPSGPADNATFDLLDAKLHAMRALGDLADKESAPRFVTFLRSREDESYSTIWEDALEPLARLDPTAAQAYAVALIRRIAEGKRAPTDPKAADGATLVREVLPLLTTRSAADLAVLQRLASDPTGSYPGWWDACNVLAARVRLGDDALRKELRAELATDLRTNRAAVCYSELMPVAFPGDDPDEVDTLLFRQRYEALLTFLDRARVLAKEGKLDTRWRDAQKKILTWLRKRSSDPDIAAGPSDRRYNPIRRAQHLAALSVLGDASARTDLDRLVDDPTDDGVAPWIAAEQALRFDLAGAADHAAKRLRWAVDHFTRRFDTDLDPMRGPLTVNDHVRVIDALAARGDPRFTLGLLDRERWGREAAATHLARKLPESACDLVAAEAQRAAPTSIGGDSIDDVFWSLSLLGDTCRPAMWKLLQDTTEPPRVRGMALELLAMLRDPRISGMLEKTGPRDDLAASRRRAKIIYFAKE